jgi:Domain of unknown function DUF302
MTVERQALGIEGENLMVVAFSAERVDEELARPFSGVVARFEQKVPRADFSVFTQLVASGADGTQIEAAVQGMAGDLDFMTLAKIDQGPLVSRLGRPKRMSVYLIGNPVLANRMYEEDPATGLYAPLRIEIHQDYAGITHFTYDRPSSLLRQFKNAKIGELAQLLDAKMSVLAAYLRDGAKE